jgi:hypothetical protein
MASMVDRDQLTAALKDARMAEAAQLESLMGLRDAKSLRLEALRTALLPSLVGHPDIRALFELNVQPGVNPRLWIDLVSSVVMEPDPRTYRLIQDRDSQRETLFETSDINHMVPFVTRYLAHRMVAHEKAAAGIPNTSVAVQSGYSLGALVYVWVTGCTFGVLGLLVIAMLLGKLHF